MHMAKIHIRVHAEDPVVDVKNSVDDGRKHPKYLAWTKCVRVFQMFNPYTALVSLENDQ